MSGTVRLPYGWEGWILARAAREAPYNHPDAFIERVRYWLAEAVKRGAKVES